MYFTLEKDRPTKHSSFFLDGETQIEIFFDGLKFGWWLRTSFSSL